MAINFTTKNPALGLTTGANFANIADTFASIAAASVMTGMTITLASDPTEAMHAVTKHYVDTEVAKIKPFTYHICTNAADTPKDVTWTSGSTTITGTLVASADTEGIIYMVPSSTSAGNYSEYMTLKTGLVYVWEPIGSTAPDISNCITDISYNSSTGQLLYYKNNAWTPVPDLTIGSVMSVTLTQGNKIVVSDSGTPITSSGTRTISHANVNAPTGTEIGNPASSDIHYVHFVANYDNPFVTDGYGHITSFKYLQLVMGDGLMCTKQGSNFTLALQPSGAICGKRSVNCTENVATTVNITNVCVAELLDNNNAVVNADIVIGANSVSITVGVTGTYTLKYVKSSGEII